MAGKEGDFSGTLTDSGNNIWGIQLRTDEAVGGLLSESELLVGHSLC